MNLLAERLQVPAHWRWTTLINGAHSDSTHKPNGVGTCRSTRWQVGNVRCLFRFYQFCQWTVCVCFNLYLSPDGLFFRQGKISEHNIVFYFIWLLVCLFFPLMAVKKISNTKNNREENRNSFKNLFVFALIHELQKQSGNISWLQLF